MNWSVFSKRRFIGALLVLIILGGLVFARLVYLDTFQKKFLLNQGDYEAVHYRPIPSTRGMILDRNGIPLAVSAPLEDIVLDPKTLLTSSIGIEALSKSPLLGVSHDQLLSLLNAHPNSRYLLLQKDLSPAQAQTVLDLRVPGVYAQTHYETYYPLGAPEAQLVGFTDVNNQGQDGLELALNKTLQNTEGREAVLRSAAGNAIGVLKIITPANNGQPITLSIDSRIQFLAYQALQQEVELTHADNGSAVVMDPYTGEVLAAVSYPSFNPNDPSDRTGSEVKDGAITDTFEPGSTIKTFTVAGALSHGQYTPTTPINVSPFWILIGGHKVHDDSAVVKSLSPVNGQTDVTGVLKYSSNVGISKIALSQPRSNTYNMIQSAGFGQNPGGGFPAETAGVLPPLEHLSTLEFANIAFGYHLAASTLQLARAYSAIANGGILYPVSFIKLQTPPSGVRILSEEVSQELITILRTVVQTGGTAAGKVNIKGYTVAGKTGTTHIAGPHGYYANKYNAVFVGIVPADHPKLVIAIHITNPQKSWIYQFGGQTAAPVFTQIASSALRILGTPATGS